jgi:ribosomal protein S18 acetylase RimI-like enzyme
MEVIDYTHERKYVDSYLNLISGIYRLYPDLARSRAVGVRKMFDKGNPFLRFGAWKNHLVFDRGKPVAHISAILDRRLPSYVGLIGYFDSLEDRKYANEAFEAAVGYLAARSKRIIRGPIDLTTWHNFRVSYPEDNPPFMLEPFTRGYYRDLFEGYGFESAQKNISTIVKIQRSGLDSYRTMYKKLKNDGFTFEAVKRSSLAYALAQIHKLAIATFGESWCFVKISFEEFVYNFQGATAAHLLYLVRNKKKKAVAFFLGARDVYSSAKKRAVLKTMGVLPEYQKLGIARALFYLVYLQARQEGASELIFSTMRQDNSKIRNLTGLAHSIYREYSVYEMKI